jgi:type VI secretion system secreted protein VgrG
MNNYSQENFQLSVVAPSGVKGLVPTRMQGWEKLGDGFEFVVDLVTQAGNPIEFRQFLEKPMVVVLALPGNATRYFHGDVFKASVKGSLGDFNKYSVTLRPRIARLALIKRSRVYQNQNVKQILESVLEAVGGA